MKLDASDFLTSAEAARLLDLTRATVRTLANAGRLPIAIRTPSGFRLFTRDAIEHLRRACEARKAVAEPLI
jgi:excisionase family DNA binding protein